MKILKLAIWVYAAMWIMSCGKPEFTLNVNLKGDEGVTKTIATDENGNVSVIYELQGSFDPVSNIHNNLEETLTKDMQVKLPLTMTEIGSSSGDRQAILHLGSYFCLYVALSGDTVYHKRAGSCNIIDETQPVPLISGTKMYLEIVYSQNNTYAAAKTEIRAE